MGRGHAPRPGQRGATGALAAPHHSAGHRTITGGMRMYYSR
ncbi:hypothetical protein BCEN4_1090099 [Burkholderia cenocepacia]|nr:hypothetical protein BCEN4_1090099 [Burkholderia cenocepacia]